MKYCLIFSLLVFQFLYLTIGYAQGNEKKNTGIVRGKLDIISKDDVTGEIMRGRSLNRYSAHGMKHTKEPASYTLSEKAVVYIESVPGSFTPPSTHPKLNQQDMVFKPLVLPIVVGTTVDFPNNDPLFHNVFSLSQPKEFDLGRYPQGEKKSVTFDKQGVVSVYCEIHSYMFATILVLQNPFYALPDEEGNYSIDNVPPGVYTVAFWFGRKKISTEKITVSANQTTIVNFTY
jgi:plastocyanin